MPKSPLSPRDTERAFEAFKAKHGYNLETAANLFAHFNTELKANPPEGFIQLCRKSPDILDRWCDAFLPFIDGASFAKLDEHRKKGATQALGLLAYPTTFVDPALWLLYACLETAAFKFAGNTLIGTSREESLTGHLFGLVEGASPEWVRRGHSLLEVKKRNLVVKKLDLQHGRFETLTGADTAIFFEVGTSSQPLVIPVLFQSKRHAARSVSLHHVTKTRDGDIIQFSTLKDQAVAAAYLFFHNGPVRRLNPTPRPPMVKRVVDLPEGDGQLPRSTPSDSGVTTLGAYVLELIHSAPEAHRFTTPEAAFAALRVSMEIRHLREIIVASCVADNVPVYQGFYDAFMDEHRPRSSFGFPSLDD